MRIGPRLFLAFGLLVLASGSLAGVGLRYMARINRDLANMYTQELVVLEVLDDAKSAAYRIRSDAFDDVLTRSASARTALTASIYHQRERLRQRIDVYRTTRVHGVEQRDLDQFASNIQQYVQGVIHHALPLAAAGHERRTLLWMSLYGEPLFARARLGVNRLMDYDVQRAHRRYKAALADYDDALKAFLWLAAGLILLGALLSVRATRSIIRPLRELIRQFEALGRGAFNQDIPTSGIDEISDVLRALAKTQDRLTENHRQLDELNQRLFAEKERLHVTLESIGDAVVTTDTQGQVLYLNPVAQSLLAASPEQAYGRPLADVFRIIDETSGAPIASPVETCLQEGHTVHLLGNTLLARAAGDVIAIEDSAAPIRDRDQQISGAVLVFRDVTTQRKLQRRITWQAEHDALTGIANRHDFEHHLALLVETAQSADRCHALCLVDLDDFKSVNDLCGHAVGDEVLREVAAEMTAAVRKSDLVARLGGDEFAVLLPDCPLERARAIAEAIVARIGQYRLPEHPQCQARAGLSVGASIGIALIDRATPSATEVLRAGDDACYQAKAQGRGRVVLYQQADPKQRAHREDVAWSVRLREALQQQRFLLYRQTIRPLGLPETHDSQQSLLRQEVLLRLQGPEGETLSPDVFIPAAERYGLITTLDTWVIQTLLARLRTDPGLADQHWSINLSGRSVSDPAFLEHVETLLQSLTFPAQQLCFEITETAAVADFVGARRFIERVKSFGCEFALDDFGRGLSSYEYLKYLPVDYIKIDGLFVRDMQTEPMNYAIVESIHGLAHRLGFATIAECVESPDLLLPLTRLGVSYVQGYAIDRPHPLDPTP